VAAWHPAATGAPRAPRRVRYAYPQHLNGLAGPAVLTVPRSSIGRASGC
jgi:hypothetical protein